MSLIKNILYLLTLILVSLTAVSCDDLSLDLDDEGYKGNELAGIIVACLFSPISVFIIRPIVLTIKRAKKKKNPNEGKIYWAKDFE